MRSPGACGTRALAAIATTRPAAATTTAAAAAMSTNAAGSGAGFSTCSQPRSPWRLQKVTLHLLDGPESSDAEEKPAFGSFFCFLFFLLLSLRSRKKKMRTRRQKARREKKTAHLFSVSPVFFFSLPPFFLVAKTGRLPSPCLARITHARSELVLFSGHELAREVREKKSAETRRKHRCRSFLFYFSLTLVFRQRRRRRRRLRHRRLFFFFFSFFFSPFF